MLKKMYYRILSHIFRGKKKAHYRKKYNQLGGNIFSNRRKALKTIKKIATEAYFVIGDSHTEVFHGNNYDGKCQIYGNEKHETKIWFNRKGRFVCYHLDAVTAYNTNNFDAKIPSLKKIHFLIDKGFLPKGCKIICSFGEIDCRVHIQKQSIKQNKSVDEVIDDVIKNYETLLLFLKNKGYNVTAYGPIPSQSDEYPIDENFPRYGTQIERNDITRRFNERLKELCERDEIDYKTLFYQLLNDDGTTNEEFISDDHVHLGVSALPLLESLFPVNPLIYLKFLPLRDVNKEHFYVLCYHSGEVFTFLILLRSRRDYKDVVGNSVLIATKKYHIDLIKMICPDMEYHFCPEAEVCIFADKKDIEYDNQKNIHVIFPKFFADALHPLWIDTTEKIHYFQKIKDFVSFDSFVEEKPELFFDASIKTVVDKYVKKFTKPFIFIAPEALTIQPLSKDFWKYLAKRLNEMGYDVFFNLMQEKVDFGQSFPLSLWEANLLARRAAGIISLRSGFSEQLALIDGVPNITLYTGTWEIPGFTAVSSERFLEICSLKKYPFTSNNIFEFAVKDESKELVEEMVSLFLNRKEQGNA